MSFVYLGLGYLLIVLIILLLILTVAFYTIAERKIMGSVQRRQGPNVVGFLGLLQAIADALKLALKEPIIPYKSNLYLFLLAPALTFTCALIQ